MTQTVILDTLTTDAAALTREQNERLFNAVEADYADIPRKADRMRSMKQDKYYSAMQVKFAYAVTCHKAQGGQWAHIYIDQGYMTDEMLTPDYIHWLYTAFTWQPNGYISSTGRRNRLTRMNLYQERNDIHQRRY